MKWRCVKCGHVIRAHIAVFMDMGEGRHIVCPPTINKKGLGMIEDNRRYQDILDDMTCYSPTCTYEHTYRDQEVSHER